MTTNHTPGPWKAYELAPDQIVSRWRVGDSRHAVAAIALSGSSTRDADNANLIAAAPDLLSALLSIMDRFQLNGGNSNHEVMIEARAAIAKAKGQA
jgi:hypothetical protein